MKFSGKNGFEDVELSSVSDALPVPVGLIVPKSIALPKGTFAEASGPTPSPRIPTDAFPPSDRKFKDSLTAPKAVGVNV